MIQLKTKLSEIKKWQVIFYCNKISDVKLLESLHIPVGIIENIRDLIKKDVSCTKVYFINNKFLEDLYICYFSKKSAITDIEFLWSCLPKLELSEITLFADDFNIQVLLDSFILSRYRFEKYLSQKKEESISVITNKNIQKKLEERIKTLENICFARDLWEMPPNELTPDIFSDLVKKTKFKNIKVKNLSFKHIQKKWLGLIEAVWKWSENKPNIVLLERIVDKNFPTIALVGKGITFDTGGLQIKPEASMYEMKWDMCWAAAVFATMKELDNKKLNVNIVACLCLAENTPSWTSYRPSDIIKSYSGKTVDVIHTDAEWRLILADGVSYVSKNYKLDHIITIATLTGACMVALWYRYAWLMGNDIKMKSKFLKYSQKSFEKYCELPFDNYFIEKTKGKIADLENLNRWVYAWASMWAAFLSNFVLNNEWYTHLDIAGPALNSYEPYWLMNKGMTGFWVDSLSAILQEM